MDNLMARANRLAGGDDCLIRGLRDEVLRLRATLSERDRMLGEAAGLARMAQMLRRVGGVLPGVKEMINSLADDADNFLSAYDASKKEKV